MKKFKDFLPDDFPGVGQGKFNKWKEARMRADKYLLVFWALATIVLFIYTAITNGLLVPICIIYLCCLAGQFVILLVFDRREPYFLIALIVLLALLNILGGIFLTAGYYIFAICILTWGIINYMPDKLAREAYIDRKAIKKARSGSIQVSSGYGPTDSRP
jgi:hypothetical protein